jgi:hypothetical protein
MIDANGEVVRDDCLFHTNEIDTEKFKNNYLSDGVQEIVECLSIKNTIPNVSAVVFKNTTALSPLLEQVKQYKVAGDWRVYIDLLKSGGMLFYNAKCLNYHRCHTSSVTRELDTQRHYDEICECQQYVADLFFDGQLSKTMLSYREFVRVHLLGNVGEG